MLRYCFTFAILLVALPRTVSAAGDDAKVDFTRDIRPILSNHCFHCHGPDANARKAELRLDTKAGAFANRDGTRILVPGKPEHSELFRRIFAKDADERMPPKAEKRRLTAKQIELIRRWIAEGANWEEHWAFVPPKRPPVPSVRNRKRVRNAIDAFVIARQERAGVELSPEARRETLIRRVTLDLTGLPPTMAEVDAFLNDTSPNAYEKVVDRLLASPSFGERMAWNWLDAGRYADTNGFQGDPERTMWPWRDWLVRAVNDNKPFDEFTIEMLAGDLFANRATSGERRGADDRISRLTPDVRLALQIATGFNRNHMINGEGGRIPEETRVENVFDRTETTATVWMGLTMTCCRCHDHKYDPITQKEYYRLFAFFNNTSEDGRGRSGQAKPAVAYMPADVQRRLETLVPEIRKLERQLASMESKFQGMLSGKPNNAKQTKAVQTALKKKPGQRDVKSLAMLRQYFAKSRPKYAKAVEALRQAQAQRDSLRKRAVRVMVMDEMKKRRETFILTRGTYNKPTERVVRGTPAFLPALPKGARPDRLTLAKWLVDSRHPLTARVTVNRYWQQFFGNGLVKTAEDFGIQGDRPSHPQLLDWLATEFIRCGWNVKHMHRLIVTSATYRQSSRIANVGRTSKSALPGSRADLKVRPMTSDPDNRLLIRFPRYRLPSWMLRDQALAISGLAYRKIGGPPVMPYQPAGVWAEATFGKKRYRQSHGSALYRRSLYVFWRRIVGPTMFFDSGDRQTCTVIPSRTNTPLHALTTLNDTTYVEAARAFAERILKAKKSDRERIVYAFQLATSRKPCPSETSILQKRLQRLRQQFQTSPKQAAELLTVGESPRDESLNPVDHAALTGVCLLILNLDEVLSRE